MNTPDRTKTKIGGVAAVALLIALIFAMTKISSPITEVNQLGHEKSLYLREHASDPVHWYPWGKAAFERARAEKKPIFLSIGFSSCVFCHVMERESFSNPAIAKIMNDNFINIQVDKFDRPDIDQFYVKASSAMVGSAGWPLNMVLTPDLEPFFAGTYFPNEARFGKQDFKTVLEKQIKVWKENRTGAIQKGREVMSFLKEQDATAEMQNDGKEIIKSALQQMNQGFDPIWGGFGAQIDRKYADPCLMDLYMKVAKSDILDSQKKKDQSKHVVDLTLENAGRGGLHDQIGGGFFRYTMDEEWIVPHFEKMLYDNALLARTFMSAYELTDRPYFKDLSCDAADFMLTKMRAPSGAFYSSFDAETAGEEGIYYTFNLADINSCMSPEDADWFSTVFKITKTGNFHEDQSVPRLIAAPEELAKKYNLSYEQFQEKSKLLLAKLRKVQEKRVSPIRDEKIICSWNALAVSGLCKVYQGTSDRKYFDAARNTAHFLLNKMMSKGKLRHCFYSEGLTELSFLEDYSFTIAALLDLSQVDVKNPYWLAEATKLTDKMLTQFKTSNGYLKLGTEKDLPFYLEEFTDQGVPSGGAVAISDLIRLDHYLKSSKYRKLAEKELKLHAKEELQGISAHSSLLNARFDSLEPSLSSNLF